MKLKALLVSALIFFAAAPGFGASSEGVDLSGPTAVELSTLANKAITAGNKDLAIYYYSQALLRQPDNLEWRLWVAEALLKRDNKESALKQARIILEQQPENTRAQTVVAAALYVPPLKSKKQAEQEEDAAAMGSVPFPEPTDVPLPKALAAWVFGDLVATADTINVHNLAASKSQQIYYFFVPAGELGIEGAKLSLKFDTRAAMALSDALAGDSMVIPVVHGLSRGWQKVPRSEWERVAAEIATKIEADKRVAGVLFDIEPHVSVLHVMFAATKKGSHKPVMAVGGERLTFKYADVGVLKCFGFGARVEDSGLSMANSKGNAVVPELRVYAGSVASAVGTFLRDARAMGGKALIGIPFSATTHEFEESSLAGDGTRSRSGLKMTDYIGAALGWVEHEIQINDETFLGIAVWSVRPDGGVHEAPDKGWYFPSVISPDLWQRLKLPLIRR